MIDFFLAAIGLSYLQQTKPVCEHKELYLVDRTVRCRGCKDYWPYTKPGSIPQNWEELVRRSLALEQKK